MTGTTAYRAGMLGLFIALLLVRSDPAEASSDKDFEKCQEMLQKQSSWLIDRADEADLAHNSRVESQVSKHVSDQPNAKQERVRISTILDRLILNYRQDEYRAILIDKATEQVLAAKNSDDFKCWEQAAVKRTFRNNLDRYERSLEELEEAIDERLGLEFLKRDEGLVVILFYARGNAQRVIINRLGAIGGGITFGPVSNGDYFRVVKAKAGSYRWHSVTNKSVGSRMTAHLKQSKLDFNVEAGKLNYVGAFLYSKESFNRYRVDVYDRASVLLSLLEDRYPELLDTIELRNGLNSENRFIEFYFREKGASQTADDDV